MKKNQSQVQGKETTLGESPIRIYIYEALNRLIHATGRAKNASYDMAMTFGRMSEPLTKVQKVDSTTTAKSYNFAYKYEDSITRRLQHRLVTIITPLMPTVTQH